MLTVVLADDHEVVRRGVRALLEAEPDLQVVGETSDGVDTAALVERLQPNLLVLDLMMPEMGGLEVIRQTRQRSPDTKIVVLSMYGNEPYVLEALRGGAMGYVLKETTAAELVRAVREAIAGRRYLSSPLSERAIEAYLERDRAAARNTFDMLTTREREVLYLAAEGRTSAEVAARLCISPRTAETHRAKLLRKLGLRSQTDLVRFALRHGILPMDR